MRETEASFRMVRNASLTRALRLAAIALGIGLVMAAGPVRAGRRRRGRQDLRGEDHRRHHGAASAAPTWKTTASNTASGRRWWCRPSSICRRRQRGGRSEGAELAEGPRRAAPQGCDRRPQEGQQGSDRSRRRILTPSELAAGKTAGTARTSNDPVQPGNSLNNPILSPSQLGYNGGLGGLFGGNKTETAPFKGEPTAGILTQPPPGYQTPSPNFAYGTGPKESLNKEYNPAAGKYGE